MNAARHPKESLNSLVPDQWRVRVAVLLVAWPVWIARHRERGACFRAFLHNNWIGAAIFAGIALHYARGGFL